jgi:hypothetical protein
MTSEVEAWSRNHEDRGRTHNSIRYGLMETRKHGGRNHLSTGMDDVNSVFPELEKANFSLEKLNHGSNGLTLISMLHAFFLEQLFRLRPDRYKPLLPSGDKDVSVVDDIFTVENRSHRPRRSID